MAFEILRPERALIQRLWPDAREYEWRWVQQEPGDNVRVLFRRALRSFAWNPAQLAGRDVDHDRLYRLGNEAA